MIYHALSHAVQVMNAQVIEYNHVPRYARRPQHLVEIGGESGFFQRPIQFHDNLQPLTGL